MVFTVFGRESFLGPIAKILSPSLEMALETFYRRAAEVHFTALARDSCIFVAAETFICENAGDNYLVSAVAILRADLELAPGHSRHRSSELAAADHDLIFDFAVDGTAIFSAPLDSWLHEQSLVAHFTSTRTRSVLWDLSRLPSGPHLPNSPSFRWLSRSFQTVPTR